MTTVTVPGVGGTTISYNFNTAQNTTLAQAIAGALAAASIGGTLNVAGTTTASSVPGFTNELAVSTTGATVFTPAGYTFVADSTPGAVGSFTVVGAQNFIGGDGNLTVFNAAGAGTDTITAGDGNDLFGLTPGSTYNVAGGNGNDTFYANGSGTVTSGTGSNLISWMPAAARMWRCRMGTTRSSPDRAVPRSQPLAVTRSSWVAPIAWKCSATARPTRRWRRFRVGDNLRCPIGRLFPWFFLLAVRRQRLVHQHDHRYHGTGDGVRRCPLARAIFNNGSSLVFASGSGDSTTIVGGASPSTLFGAAGSSINFFGTGGGAEYSAGPGNESFSAAGSTSPNTLFGGSGTDSLAGGLGNDALLAGTGVNTLTGGGGNDQFIFTHGFAGGTDVITDFNSNDLSFLSGYGSAAGANALASATVSGGATTIALSDNTKITFDNITSPGSIKTFST